VADRSDATGQGEIVNGMLWPPIVFLSVGDNQPLNSVWSPVGVSITRVSFPERISGAQGQKKRDEYEDLR
jgi:hypothetical protein